MSSASASPSGSSPAFFKTELKRALSEQAFGIVSYSLGMISAYDASASVELLENVQLDITLTVRGFKVTGGSVPAVANGNAEFETLDALLQHYSPMYAAKRTELLFAKLTA